MTARPLALALLVAWSTGCGDGDELPSDDLDPAVAFSGGETTTFQSGRDAFAQAAENLVGDRRGTFFTGNSIFNRNWVTAPASTTGLDGLGPTFNARSCSSCHFKDGRGRPPEGDEAMTSMLLRLSVPGRDPHGGPAEEPNYGGQFNPSAILGVPAEGSARIETKLVSGQYPDGEPYELSVPAYRFEDLAFGPLAGDVQISPRVAPANFGLGLLEAIDEATIVAGEDPDDRDQDGISGRVNRVWDYAAEAVALGRFGWKANQPTIVQQTAGAFLGDIGITSSLFPEQNCPAPQTDCRGAESGGAPELSDKHLHQVVYYSMLLAVPARRDIDDARVRRGERLFRDVGCTGCHTETFETGVLPDYPELSRQVIHPYSDLLLHDLGEELADDRPDFEASGREWRTAPLWGIGLVEAVNGHTRFLHDGRARSLEEAILWHGGEASDSRDAFKSLDEDERRSLIRFLESL